MFRSKSTVAILIGFFVWVSLEDVFAQQPVQKNQEKKIQLTDEDGKNFSIQFLSYVPKRKDKNKKLPLLLFLHGAGERGDDLSRVKIWGPPKMIENGHDFDAVVISPQCPKNVWWNTKQLKALLDHQIKEHSIDLDRVYVTGLSMGGFATWKLLSSYPKFFAAAVPVCGGGSPKKSKDFVDVPVWAFHGDADKVVPISGSRRMIESLKAAGGDPKFTVYKGVGHNSWSKAYGDKSTFRWLFKQVRKKQTKKRKKKSISFLVQ